MNIYTYINLFIFIKKYEISKELILILINIKKI